MNEKNNENLKELLAKFLSDDEALKAADDIAEGNRIFEANHVPQPSPALLAEIKQRMEIAAETGRNLHGTHYFVWRAAVAAAIVFAAWAGVMFWQNHSQMRQDMQAKADMLLWHETSENAIDAQLAQLNQTETDTDTPVITFETAGKHDLAIMDVADELNEIKGNFWER